MTTTQKNDINKLRDVLFESIERIKSGSTKDIQHERAIADAAQVIINTAKVEIDYIKATGAKTATNFLPEESVNSNDRVGGYVHRTGQKYI